ncbi:NAD-binding protein [Candidatus Marsarchaeota archaeon]|nr:NAD-binding protein [Candidatus Marsarchaeota archaeon]MCL5404425.1 NAD-binding protein [Candidatus Marsarchaeota archaeon]
MSVGNTKIDMPLEYITVLVAIVLASGIITTIYVNSSVHNIYDSSYFTLSALFDINGVKLNPTIGYYSTVLAAPFYSSFTILMFDGVIKIVAIGFILAGVVELITSIDIFERLNIANIKKMKNGIIVCGYNSLAEDLCTKLKSKKKSFIVIDKDQAKIDILHSMGYTSIRGDFTDANILKKCSVGNAKSIVFTTENDFENLLGTVTAHYLNPKLNIITRARSEQSITKMHRAGVTLCVVPEILAGLDLGDRISETFGFGR